jgi:2-(1,2-epoxy-1,2-dihydrophenyl)acetyl-CoA isomerase
MADEEILFEVDEKGIALMTLNRPEKFNAVTVQMSKGLFPKLFKEIQADDKIRALIITGAGKGFCSGAEVSAKMKANIMSGGGSSFKRLAKEEPVGGFMLTLAAIRKPVISAINGIAAGVGFSISLLSDIRIASNNARFCAVFVRRGLMPDGGLTVTLPRIVGLSKALELAMTGDVIGADEALRIGLVNKVVPQEELMKEARAVAERLASGPPIALSFIKRALYRNVNAGFEEGLYFESWGQNVLLNTADHTEGVNSFLEKRPPVFTGE